mgnify:CR=1 FL=1
MPREPTIRERLAVVETQIGSLKEDIRRVDSKLSDFKRFVYQRLDLIQGTLSDLNQNLAEHDPELRSRDKAAITIALITSITSIIVALIQVVS